MATVNKNFRIKDGLIVEGTTGTINGYDIFTAANTTDDITEGSTNLFFTAQRAADAVADEISTAVSAAVDALTTSDIEEGTNLYFTAQRAVDAGDGVFDAYGSAANAESAAKTFATGEADAALADANSYTDTAISGLSTVYDALGAAATAQGNAEDYTDSAIAGLSTVYDVLGAAATAQANAEDYADSLAVNYDAAGSAATAEGNANDYTDSAISSEVTNRNSAIATAKGEANDYTDTAVANLVDGAPALLDTLNELAAALQDNPDIISDLQDIAAGKQDALTAGTGIDITGATISVSANTYDAYGAAVTAEGNANDYTDSSIAGLSTVYDALGAAATAEANANDYADTTFVTLASLPGQLDDYIPTTEKGAALGVATLDASGYVPASQLNIDVTGDITAAIDALTTDDIEEGSTNLYFTNTRAVDALEAVTPNFTNVDVNSVARQIAATASVTGSTSNSVYTFRNANYKSAKFLVKVTVGSDTEVSEVLLVTDLSGNIAITEYANVASNVSLSSITASYVGGSFISLDVTPTGNGTVKVFGTLLV